MKRADVGILFFWLFVFALAIRTGLFMLELFDQAWYAVPPAGAFALLALVLLGPELLQFAGEAWVLIRKDLLIEWRTRARINALIFFSIATLLMFSFALGADIVALRSHAPGYLWLAMLFSSVLSLGESFRIEHENYALDGLRLAPANPRAIFVGKALGNTVLLWGLGLVLTPLSVALFDLRIKMSGWLLVALLGIGSMAISAAGTFYAAVAANARARDVLLPVLLFPVLAPVLIGSVKATSLVLGGDPMNQMDSWLTLLATLNIIYWSMGFVLFPRIVEDL